MAKKRKKIKRRRRFSTFTEEGRKLSLMSLRLKRSIPDDKERFKYIKALIEDFDERIAEKPDN